MACGGNESLLWSRQALKTVDSFWKSFHGCCHCCDEYESDVRDLTGDFEAKVRCSYGSRAY